MSLKDFDPAGPSINFGPSSDLQKNHDHRHDKAQVSANGPGLSALQRCDEGPPDHLSGRFEKTEFVFCLSKTKEKGGARLRMPLHEKKNKRFCTVYLYAGPKTF